MAQREQSPEEKGSLPRSREAVDWWLKKWVRQPVIDGTEPLSRKDVERLIEVNGGTGKGLYLVERNMAEIELDDVDLQGAILVSTRLERASLWGANLAHAQLADANLRNTNLRVADLREAYADGADLTDSDLSEADLRGAELSGSKLLGANLAGARITADTDLEDAEWGKGYISVLEDRHEYDDAVSVYRRLKEWYRGAGMLKIAGEFHYREEQTVTKQQYIKLGEGLKKLKNTFGSALRRKKANREGV